MRFSKIAFVCICLLGLALPARSQKPEGPAEHGIPGFLDPRTGAFKPMAKVAVEGLTLAPVSTTGNFKVSVTVTVKSAIPSTETVTCTFSASVFGDTSGRSFLEEMAVAATGTGSTRTCTLDMFYSWPLSSPTGDKVSLSVFVAAPGAGSFSLPERFSNQTLPTINVPTSGSTTMETITATI